MAATIKANSMLKHTLMARHTKYTMSVSPCLSLTSLRGTAILKIDVMIFTQMVSGNKTKAKTQVVGEAKNSSRGTMGEFLMTRSLGQSNGVKKLHAAKK